MGERRRAIRRIMKRLKYSNAAVAELADAPDLGSGGRKVVEVRVLSAAILWVFDLAQVEPQDG